MKILEFVEQLFSQYGYLVLLIGLPLDAIALPLPPGNTTLAFTGYLSYKGVLHLLLSMAAAYTGSVLGITITYWIGNKIGLPLIQRYGKWLFLKPKHLKKARKLYKKYGNKVLFFSFFIPGVRQLNGYFSGIFHVPFRTFVKYAYTGAALWVLVFIGIGYVFGNQWQFFFTWSEKFLTYIFIALCSVLVIYLLLRWRSRVKTRLEMIDGELD
jgi:membrane protein DedA with SNARE-associated domain